MSFLKAVYISIFFKKEFGEAKNTVAQLVKLFKMELVSLGNNSGDLSVKRLL